MNVYAYKANDERQRSEIIAAWIDAAPILHQHLKDHPRYEEFIQAMLKVITLSDPEEIVEVISPGIYESRIIPGALRKQIDSLWQVLYQNLQLYLSETKAIQDLSVCISALRIPAENIAWSEA